VPDAIDLPSTLAAPRADELGPAAAQRRATGTWNCCGAPGAQFHNP
jgi:hypothetical protein